MNYYFVTGSSKGLGKAITEQLLQKVDNFVFGYSRSNTINHKQYYHKLIDFSNLEAVQKLRFPELKDAKKLVLINNAGSVGEIKHVGKLSAQKIIECYNINLVVPTIITNEFLNAYQNSNIQTLIVNISSGAGQSAIDGWSVYCATKAGIDMFSRVVQEEANIHKSNIKVLSIAPGIIDTDMQKEIRKSAEENFSNINRFVDYKKNGDLSSAEEAATKVLQFINSPSLSQNVVCSVRDLTN
ncbi:MAG: SDR family NAD(P)-dependent oxidoreductase [Flavobacteriales bacterium]